MLSRKDLPQLVRFLIVGIPSAIIYIPLLYALTEFAGMWYIASAIIAAIVSNAATFVFQKVWVFKNAEPRAPRKQLIPFLSVGVGLMLLSLALLYVFVEYIGLPYFWASMAISPLLTVISYLISRRIFKKNPPAP